VILRGGKKTNYDAESINTASEELEKAGLKARLMIDASHANSNKKAENQTIVCADVASQIEKGDSRIMGVMIESHLLGGRQDLVSGTPLVYGQSITDACIGWEESVPILDSLAAAVRHRRAAAVRS
jgi:3-deoxy-7-phosphoheptulonate synthase